MENESRLFVIDFLVVTTLRGRRELTFRASDFLELITRSRMRESRFQDWVFHEIGFFFEVTTLFGKTKVDYSRLGFPRSDNSECKATSEYSRLGLSRSDNSAWKTTVDYSRLNFSK